MMLFAWCCCLFLEHFLETRAYFLMPLFMLSCCLHVVVYFSDMLLRALYMFVGGRYSWSDIVCSLLLIFWDIFRRTLYVFWMPLFMLSCCLHVAVYFFWDILQRALCIFLGGRCSWSDAVCTLLFIFGTCSKDPHMLFGCHYSCSDVVYMLLFIWGGGGHFAETTHTASCRSPGRVKNHIVGSTDHCCHALALHVETRRHPTALNVTGVTFACIWTAPSMAFVPTALRGNHHLSALPKRASSSTSCPCSIVVGQTQNHPAVRYPHTVSLWGVVAGP